MRVFLLHEINMPKLIDRQIESDEHGYYCIDTYDSDIDYPFCGFGYSEHEAIQEAERQARKQLAKRMAANIEKSINSGSIEVPRFNDDSEFVEWMNK